MLILLVGGEIDWVSARRGINPKCLGPFLHRERICRSGATLLPEQGRTVCVEALSAGECARVCAVTDRPISDERRSLTSRSFKVSATFVPPSARGERFRRLPFSERAPTATAGAGPHADAQLSLDPLRSSVFARQTLRLSLAQLLFPRAFRRARVPLWQRREGYGCCKGQGKGPPRRPSDRVSFTTALASSARRGPARHQ
jgi:hypothetical protein